MDNPEGQDEAFAEAATRLAGAVEAAGGVGQATVGGLIVGAGLSDGDFAVSTLGGVVLATGVDATVAGLRQFLTGAPQETELYKFLREVGYSDQDARVVEFLTSGLSPSAALKAAPREISEAAAQNVRAMRLAPFRSKALNVRIVEQSLWKEPNILARGKAWEIYDAKRTGYIRTHHSYETFDQVSRDRSVWVSNKTLDMKRVSYTEGKRALFHATKRYLDQVANARIDQFDRAGRKYTPQRRLHLLLPAGLTLPKQEMQLAELASYARRRGVVLQVEFAR